MSSKIRDCRYHSHTETDTLKILKELFCGSIHIAARVDIERGALELYNRVNLYSDGSHNFTKYELGSSVLIFTAGQGTIALASCAVYSDSFLLKLEQLLELDRITIETGTTLYLDQGRSVVQTSTIAEMPCKYIEAYLFDYETFISSKR